MRRVAAGSLGSSSDADMPATAQQAVAAGRALLLLGFVFLALGLIVDPALGAGAGAAGAWLRRRAGARRVIDRVAGTMLGALGVRLLVSGRR